jgi:hypothetical protein
MQMKNLLLTTALAFTTLCGVSAQNQPVPVPTPMPGQPGQMAPVTPEVAQNPEFVKFNEIVYDFGNIKQGTPVTHTFVFKNVGTRDINLVNVAASCGCTTPNWKGGAYKPQESGEINATFNAASEGGFTKTITVTTSEGVVLLTITGKVMPVAEYDTWKAADDAAKAKEAAAKKPASKSKEKAKAKTSTEATKPKSAKSGS